MKTTATILTLILLVACGGQQNTASQSAQPAAETPAVVSANLTPEQLGELGAKMRKDPAKADELLTQHGLTRESFEKAIRDVTENPEASKRYADSYRRASA